MKTYLYFFAHAGRIKIGVSTNVDRRLRDIGLHLPSPPTCIGYIEGGYALERHVHGILAEHRLTGEWFSNSPRVNEIINHLLSSGPSSINFKPPTAKESASFTPKPQTHEEWLATINKLTQHLWPDDPIGGYAQLMGVSPEQAKAWLGGEERIPDVNVMAFAAFVIQWMFKREPE